jgi:RNA polymerase sigma-70 factor (ECF subfamily)
MSEIHARIEAEIPSLRRYARALVRDVVGADDLVQECLTRALAKLDLWREGTDLRAWLFTILHNQYVNHVRRSIRTGTPVEFDGEGAPVLSRPPNQEKRLELRDLDRALARLPQEQRAVILLVGLEGMPYGDVAVALGVPVGTVRSRLSRGRLALRQMMGVETDQRNELHPTRTPARRQKMPDSLAALRHSSLLAAAN